MTTTQRFVIRLVQIDKTIKLQTFSNGDQWSCNVKSINNLFRETKCMLHGVCFDMLKFSHKVSGMAVGSM